MSRAIVLLWETYITLIILLKDFFFLAEGYHVDLLDQLSLCVYNFDIVSVVALRQHFQVQKQQRIYY